MTGICFLLAAGLLFLSSVPFSIAYVEEACRATPLDMRLYSSADDVQNFLADCGENGRAAYRNLQIADLIYPAVSGLFMGSALALTFTHLFPRRPSMAALGALALLGGGFDYLENVFAWRALAAYPDVTASDSLLGLASMAKTVTFWLAGTLLVYGLAALAAKAVWRRSTSSPEASSPDRGR